MSTVNLHREEVVRPDTQAYILAKKTKFGSYVACTVAPGPSEALARILEDMDKKRYKEIGYDSLLRDTWLIPPPDQLTEADLTEVPPGMIFEMIQES
jgi:hypothetical protein